MLCKACLPWRNCLCSCDELKAFRIALISWPIHSNNLSDENVVKNHTLPRHFFQRLFPWSAGAILLITALGKFWGATGSTKLLTVFDPMLGIQFRHLMIAVGVAELFIAFVCFFKRRTLLATGLVGWLATNFLVYRLGLWWMDWKRPCGCLGNLTDALHISPRAADSISKALLAYLLVGSYSLLLWHWRQRREESAGVGFREDTGVNR